MKMTKAALYDGKAMRISEIPRPKVEPDSVVVRVRMAGICGSDVILGSERDEPEELPAGHEVTGEIVATGAGVEGWSVGDRVAVDTICQGTGCGTCNYCLSGEHFHYLSRRSAQHSGGFTEYIQRKAAGCYRIPDGVSWLEAALTEPLAVGVHCCSISDGRHDFDVALEILAAHQLPLKDMVTHTFSLDQAQEALQTAYDKSTGAIKVLLMPV